MTVFVFEPSPFVAPRYGRRRIIVSALVAATAALPIVRRSHAQRVVAIEHVTAIPMDRNRTVEDATILIAVEVYPTSFSAHYELGRAYLAAGDSAAARASFRRSVALSPHNAVSVEALEQLAAAVPDQPTVPAQSRVVTFRSGTLTLHGVLYIPEGAGPFRAIVYNHGSAAGMLPKQAFDVLGPVFAKHGWVFFGPYRRGQGLSASAGKYIGDEIAAATKSGGLARGAEVMVHLLETDQLQDQLAALAWLQKQSFVRRDRIAVAGNSFGGILSVLGAEHGSYCAAVNSAGGAQSWADAPPLRAMMVRSVRKARAPIFFFQAENDYDLSPSRVLSDTMRAAGKEFELEIFPPFGTSVQDGHTFGYFGDSVWAADVFRFLNKHCPT